MSSETQTTDTPEAPEPPPRGVKGMAILRWALVAVSALAAMWTWSAYVSGQHLHGASSSTAAKTKYQCPMHPQIVSDEPGECPICHMALVPIAPERTVPSAPSSSPSSAPSASVSNPHAGHMAPIPGAAPSHPQAGRVVPSPSAVASAGTIPLGTTPIALTFDRVQSIGMRTSVAEERDTGGSVRVTATVAAPEQGMSEVHVRSAGFVERINVRETGVRVGAGQEMLGVYSPDVFSAESELLAAKSFGEAGVRSVEAARRKLELLGMSARAIDDVLASGKPARVVSIVAPSGGFVSKKSVVLGSYVTPEMALYEIVDLSRVYVVAEVFQRDIANVRVGTEGKFTSSVHPDKTLVGKIDLIYPQVAVEARTTRVRMQLDNKKLDLRPGEYGTVELALPTRKSVVVPRDAIVDTGRVQYVFVDDGNGHLTPRTVAMGGEIGDEIEILAGVSAGDRIVTSATFLVDSESRLQASLGQAGSGVAPSHTHGQ